MAEALLGWVQHHRRRKDLGGNYVRVFEACMA